MHAFLYEVILWLMAHLILLKRGLPDSRSTESKRTCYLDGKSFPFSKFNRTFWNAQLEVISYYKLINEAFYAFDPLGSDKKSGTSLICDAPSIQTTTSGFY